MTDVKVEQCDRVAAHAVVLCNLIAASGSELPWMREALADILEGKEDGHYMVQAFARHRQAAEKAQQERDAAYIKGRVKHYQAKIDKTHPDDGELIEMRQHTVEALEVIATAIRSQGHE